MPPGIISMVCWLFSVQIWAHRTVWLSSKWPKPETCPDSRYVHSASVVPPPGCAGDWRAFVRAQPVECASRALVPLPVRHHVVACLVCLHLVAGKSAIWNRALSFVIVREIMVLGTSSKWTTLLHRFKPEDDPHRRLHQVQQAWHHLRPIASRNASHDRRSSTAVRWLLR